MAMAPWSLAGPPPCSFGNGDDTLTVQAGTINGHVEQGLGADTLTMTGGTMVLTGLWFDGDANSKFGTGIDVSGNSIAASVEGGFPIALTRHISLEPQAQLIWQHLSLDDEQDAFSTVGFSTAEGFTGRVGIRLQGSFGSGKTLFWQPYLS